MEGVDPKKLFVGGISQLTDETKLEAYFRKFGNVMLVDIKREPEDANTTGKKHRGFGFVTFESPDSAVNVLAQPVHVLDEKQIDPKPAEMKSAAKPLQSMVMNQSGEEDCEKKIFVGGIGSGTTEDDIRGYFAVAYPGIVVMQVELKHDKMTNRMRGFGFVTLETQEQAARVCQKRFHEINGKSVEMKKAQPRQARQTRTNFQAFMGYDYSQTNGQPYQQAFYSNGQYYGYDTTAVQAAAAAGYSQYGGGAGYSYDPSAYTHNQTSSGARQNTQTYYQQQANPYGHSAAQQLQTAGYSQDTGAYGTGRNSGYTTQDAAAYGGQSAYGGGGASVTSQQPTGHYQTGSSSYGNH